MNSSPCAAVAIALALTTLGVLPGWAEAAEPVRVQFVSGEVKAIGADGSTRTLTKGDVVGSGDRLITGDNGLLQLRAEGQGVVALRSDTEVVLPSVDEGLTVNLQSGQLRTVTGFPGQDGNVKLTTPAGVVDVANGDVVTAVMPAGEGTPGGETIHKVNAGVANLGNAGGEGPVVVEAGKAVAIEGAEVRDLAAAELPPSINPEVPGPALAGAPGLPTDLPAVQPEGLKQSEGLRPALPASGPLVRVAGLPSGNLGNAGVAGLPTAQNQPRLPDIRPTVTTLEVSGGGTTINGLLGAVPVVQLGRGGTGVQTATIVDSTTVGNRAPSSKTILTSSVQTGSGGDAVSVLQTNTRTSLVNSGVTTDQLVIRVGTIPNSNFVRRR
jgi:hypothetical protein